MAYLVPFDVDMNEAREQIREIEKNNKPKYYDGTKLLSLKDLDGEKPELYICTSNRTGGKTTYFGRLVVNRFIESGSKFCLIYRYNYQIDDCAEKFFKDLKGLFFNEYDMTNKRRASGIFHELYLNEEPCGYAVSLNSADTLKTYSHLFSDVDRMLFDEFQSETNHYCTDELRKFISLHTSIARGQGQQTRYVPVYMLSNPVSLINPYYTEMGISARLQENTKFLRGNGFVLEQGFVKSASNALLSSGFNKAFAKNRYVAYASEGIYLNDKKAFIEKPEGKGKYLCTIKYESEQFSIKEYLESGILHCSRSVDKTFKYKIVVNTDDHDINYVMLKKNDFFLTNLRWYFEHGCFRFQDLRCKEIIMKMLSY